MTEEQEFLPECVNDLCADAGSLPALAMAAALTCVGLSGCAPPDPQPPPAELIKQCDTTGTRDLYARLVRRDGQIYLRGYNGLGRWWGDIPVAANTPLSAVCK